MKGSFSVIFGCEFSKLFLICYAEDLKHMTIQWVDTDAMSHYHHMGRHEIYLLCIINPYIKQLDTNIPETIDGIILYLVFSFFLEILENTSIVCL